MSELTVDFEATRDEIGDIVQKNKEGYYLKVENNANLFQFEFSQFEKTSVCQISRLQK